MRELDRITVAPDGCLGQPTIRGMRITVSVILKMLALGGHTRPSLLTLRLSAWDPASISRKLLDMAAGAPLPK